MVRGWARWALGLCLLTQSLTAKEIAGEWILTIDVPGNWAIVAKSLRGQAVFLRALGSSQRFALFSATSRSSFENENLSSHVLGIQPNFSYSHFDQKILERTVPQRTDLQLENAWKVSKGSSEVRVGILDTGIDKNHEDLHENLGRNLLEIPGNGKDDDGNGWVDDDWGWDFINQTNNPQDDKGHGSFCAGVIGADWENDKGTQGINRNVSLLAVKILDSFGQGSTATAIEGIEYAIESGVHIINASWGGNRFDPALFETVKKASEKGILVVAAAGNSSQNNDQKETAVYPASFKLPGVISVAAYDNQGTRAPFSNWGQQSVHLGAPGVDVFGIQLGGYGIKSGTSFAAPQVAGVAALLKAASPQMKAVDIKKRILDSVNPLNYYEKYYTQSGGFISAANALTETFPEKPKSPRVWKKIPFAWSSPHPYLSSSIAQVSVHQPGATFIRINFKNFTVEQDFDKVVLTDREGRKVKDYSGELLDFTSVEAVGDEVRIELVSDYNRQFYGFDIDSIELSYD